MIEDVIQSIQDTMNAIAPPGVSAITPSAGATGVVAFDAGNLILGQWGAELVVTFGGAIGTARATITLDGGLTTSPEFVIPPAISPATHGVYNVPLLDQLNPGGNPSPVLSGLVLDFSGTFTGGDSYSFVAAPVNSFLFGEENLPAADVLFPVVRWVPISDTYTGSEDYAQGSNQRISPRSLLTTVSRVDAHVWGIDRRNTDTLRRLVISGIWNAALGVSNFEGGEWITNKDQIGQAGRLYVLHFSVKTPTPESELSPFVAQAPPPFVPNISPVFNQIVDNELIPDTVNTIGHWTAFDLDRGGSHIGPVWTKNGNVALNPAASTFPRRASVGSFSDSNNYSQGPGNILDIVGSFTVAVVATSFDNSNFPTPIGCGGYDGPGWLMEVFATGPANSYAFSVGNAEFSTLINTCPPAVPHVMMAGFDADAGMAWYQIDGDVTYHFPATLAHSGLAAYIGRWKDPTFALNGRIYEVWISTDKPSSAFFKSIHDAVLVNGAHP